MRQKRVRKFCRKSRNIFCNDPFPTDPISELVILVDFRRKEYGYQTTWSRFGGGSKSTPGALPYRCDTPYRAILFQGGKHSPKWCDTPLGAIPFTQANRCDTPSFATYRAIIVRYPIQKQARKSFSILSLQASQNYMKSIAIGPLSPGVVLPTFRGQDIHAFLYCMTC